MSAQSRPSRRRSASWTRSSSASSGETRTIDELTKLWERGEELYRCASTKLDGVRGRIEELSRTTES